VPPFIQLEQPHWNQFLRQLKIAAGDASDVKNLWATLLEPMRAGWAQLLPGSLSRTAKVRKKAASGEIWAGNRNKHGDRPFLPWLEFGGTIRHERGPRKGVELVPFPWGIRAISYKEGIKRARVKEGRWMGPAIEGKTDDVAREFAEGIVAIFDKHFK